MENLTEKQIEVAVNWWAEKIANPKFDNGDDSMAGGMSSILAMMAKEDVSKDQQEAFKNALTTILRDENPMWIGSDYGPDMNLGKAMELAGISTRNAPWKTDMSFRSGGVRVSYGYGSEYQDLMSGKAA